VASEMGSMIVTTTASPTPWAKAMARPAHRLVGDRTACPDEDEQRGTRRIPLREPGASGYSRVTSG